MKHERQWFDDLQSLADGTLTYNGNPTKKLLIIAPPGAGKSQVMILFLSWMIGRNPMKHYGLLSYADAPAWDRGSAVKKLIESDKAYKLVFPEDLEWASELGVTPVIPDLSKWSVSNFRLLRERLSDPHPTLRAGGIRSAVISYRFDGLVVDDPIDPKNVTTTKVIEKGFKNYEHAVTTRAVEDHWQITIGTRFAADDHIGRLKKRKNDNWKEVHIKALNTRGESYWPEMYSTKYLHGLKEDSPDMFQLQYMGDVSGGSMNPIRKLITYEGVPEFRQVRELNMTRGQQTGVVLTRSLWLAGQPRDLLIGAGVDTAMKDKQESDWNVLYVGGLDKFGVLWVLDRRKGHWSLLELKEQFQEINSLWTPYRFWVEDTAKGTPVLDVLIAEEPFFPIQLEPATQGGKRARAHAISLYLHDGRVRWPAEADWYQDAEYYLTHFGTISLDDDLDALYQLVFNLQRQKHPAMYSEPRPRQRIVMK